MVFLTVYLVLALWLATAVLSQKMTTNSNSTMLPVVHDLVKVINADSVTTTPTAHNLSQFIEIAVDVYFESLCPDSKWFINQQLAENFPLFEPFVDLKLIPFGKSKSTSYGFECQHGPRECMGNMIMSCALSMLPPGQKQLDFVDCYMRSPNTYLSRCASLLEISELEVDTCVRSTAGRNLQLEAERLTQTFTPGPKFVPTVVINKMYNEYDQADIEAGKFLKLLCRYLPNVGPCVQ